MEKIRLNLELPKLKNIHMLLFSFSGGREKPFNFEKEFLKDSPKVATYDMKPEMSAYEITEELILKLKIKQMILFV